VFSWLWPEVKKQEKLAKASYSVIGGHSLPIEAKFLKASGHPNRLLKNLLKARYDKGYGN
jgi:hypothetical protein